MTAATAPPAALSGGDHGLVDSLLEELSETALVALLVRRLRAFVAAGYTPEDAALLAVGRDPRRDAR